MVTKLNVAYSISAFGCGVFVSVFDRLKWITSVYNPIILQFPRKAKLVSLVYLFFSLLVSREALVYSPRPKGCPWEHNTFYDALLRSAISAQNCHLIPLSVLSDLLIFFLVLLLFLFILYFFLLMVHSPSLFIESSQFFSEK